MEVCRKKNDEERNHRFQMEVEKQTMEAEERKEN